MPNNERIIKRYHDEICDAVEKRYEMIVIHAGYSKRIGATGRLVLLNSDGPHYWHIDLKLDNALILYREILLRRAINASV